jgi:hypothetical protein
VDFAAGSDDRDGLSAQAAWKRCPGDPAAAGKAKAARLAPGDTVLFKGGVVYRGSVDVPASGEAGAVLTFKGDGWGEGKAVIDGGAVLEANWTRCASADELRGNKNFAKVFYTAAPKGYDFLAGTYEGSEFLYPCQDPPPSDPFNCDRVDQLRVLPAKSGGASQTDTSITDPRHFTQADAAYYDGASVLVWHQPNVTRPYRVTGYDANAHTVLHEKAGGAGVYKDRDTRYALVNHPALLSAPGQYCHEAKTGRLYVWPRKGDDPSRNEYSVAASGAGISASGKHHLVIEGFVVQKFVFGIRAIDEGARDVVIRNNEVRSLKSNEKYAIHADGTNMRVIGNRVLDCQRAVGILAGGQNVLVQGNFVQRAGRQGIWFMGASHSQILDNTVVDCQGAHANGMSVYAGCADVLVRGNRVSNSNAAFTSQASQRITVERNVFLSGGTYAFADWGGCPNLKVRHNTVLRTDDLTSITIGGGSTAEMKNNIFSGNAQTRGLDKNHNLHVVRADWAAVFADAAKGDVRLKAGSLAIDAAEDLGDAADLAGTKVPQGKAPDAGALELAPEK